MEVGYCTCKIVRSKGILWYRGCGNRAIVVDEGQYIYIDTYYIVGSMIHLSKCITVAYRSIHQCDMLSSHRWSISRSFSRTVDDSSQ